MCRPRSHQPVPGGGPGLVPSARVGAGVLSADGRQRGELAPQRQVPAARLLHLRPDVRLWGQGGRGQHPSALWDWFKFIRTTRTFI